MFFSIEKFINRKFLYHLIRIKKYLNKQKRRLRSFRGYFLYALEIQRTGDLKVLKTNLNYTFWSDIDSVLRQNRRDLLLQFLFEKPFENNFNEKIDSRLILQKIETIETNFTLLKPEEKEKVLQSVDNVKFRDLNLISNEEMEIIILEGAEKKKSGIITLKNYYESEQPGSLFERSGYHLRYNNVRSLDIYKKINTPKSYPST